MARVRQTILIRDKEAFDNLVEKAAKVLEKQGYPVSNHGAYDLTISAVVESALMLVAGEKPPKKV